MPTRSSQSTSPRSNARAKPAKRTPASGATLTLRELNRATLARQHLLARSALTPLAMIEHLAGMQAQVPKPPFIGLWTRLARFSRDDLHALITSKQAVRATTMRATIHLHSARDYLALRPILQDMLSRAGASLIKDRANGVSIAALTKFATKAFPATFADIRTALLAAFPNCDERALAYTIRLHVPLVLEPTETQWSYAGNARFLHAPTYLGATLGPAHDAAVDQLVLRYLAAFGPASIKDAQAWSGDRNLAAAFERLRPSLVTFRDEANRELFDLPDAPRPPADTPVPVRFLPDYDNLMLGHAERTRIVDDAFRKFLVTKNLVVPATYLVDGRIAGRWAVTATKKAATLTLHPFTKLTRAARAALEEEGEALLAFAEPAVGARAVTVAK